MSKKRSINHLVYYKYDDYGYLIITQRIKIYHPTDAKCSCGLVGQSDIAIIDNNKFCQYCLHIESISHEFCAACNKIFKQHNLREIIVLKTADFENNYCLTCAPSLGQIYTNKISPRYYINNIWYKHIIPPLLHSSDGFIYNKSAIVKEHFLDFNLENKYEKFVHKHIMKINDKSLLHKINTATNTITYYTDTPLILLDIKINIINCILLVGRLRLPLVLRNIIVNKCVETY